MNTLVQNILVFTALAIAIIYLVKKYIWSTKKKSSGGCATEDCGCH
jgi:hypothetical protein